jgi:translocation and assembly module TamB
MKPTPEISVNYQIRNSSVNGRVLSGQGKFMLTEKKLQIDALDLIAGDNSMHVQGQADKNTSKLQLAINARDLSQLGGGFQGSAKISANITGTTDKPFIDMTWRAHHLSLAGKIHIEKTVGAAKFHLVRDSSFLITQCDAHFFAENIRSEKNAIQLINLNANINLRKNSIADLQFSAKNISYANAEIKNIRAEVLGEIDDHKIITYINTKKENITLEANGKFKDINSVQTWHGILKKAEAKGQVNAKLRNDAIMLASKEFFKIELISIDTNFGNFSIEFFKRDKQLTASKGNLRNLDLLKFLKIIHAKDLSDKTDLLMDGDWDIEINENISSPTKATFNLRRTQGDIVLPGEQPLVVGLKKLNMECKSDKNHLTAKFEAEGGNLGLLRLHVETTFNKENKFPDLNAPINATLDINMPSIAWTSKMISSNLIVDGSMQSKIILSGSLQEPNFNGSINGNKLNLLLIDSGISLKEGNLSSEFSGNTINIQQLKFLGSSGFILATGPIKLEKNKIQTNLHWQADKLTVFDSPDRKLIVTGSGKISSLENQINVQGDLLVDQGIFDIGRADTPKLADDVIIIGQKNKTTQFPSLSLDIGIGLGQRLVLRGRGLDARIDGALRVLSNKDRSLSVFGLMQSINGTYQAYGRMLSLERGILRFDGQPGNPALDIRAIRRGMEVDAGVAIGGNAMAPRISLVSEPQVPDADKLSWLVLGQGLYSASGTQAVELQSAAGSLLTERAAAGLQSQIANALGIDSISIAKSQDTLQERIVTLGKRVSSRLYVSYQQGLHTASSLLLFRYSLSPRLTLETETGNRSVFSLFYNINYD